LAAYFIAERLRVLLRLSRAPRFPGGPRKDVEKLVGTTAAEKAALGKLLA
jgi:hypothetical protein